MVLNIIVNLLSDNQAVQLAVQGILPSPGTSLVAVHKKESGKNVNRSKSTLLLKESSFLQALKKARRIAKQVSMCFIVVLNFKKVVPNARSRKVLPCASNPAGSTR